MKEGGINMMTDTSEIGLRVGAGDLTRAVTPEDFVAVWRQYLEQDAPKSGDEIIPAKLGLVRALEWLDGPEVKAAIDVKNYEEVLDLAQKRVGQYEAAAKQSGEGSANEAIYKVMNTFTSMLRTRMPGGEWARRDSNSRSSS